LIDELESKDVAMLTDHLKRITEPSEVAGLFWAALPDDLLSSEQFKASGDHPFGFAVEVGESWAKFEFLIRSRSNFRSLWTRYATFGQTHYILEYAQGLIDELGLKT
jgi:hypothetical protein